MHPTCNRQILTVGSGVDTLTGDVNANRLSGGGGGGDSLTGDLGDDILVGGRGGDILTGGADHNVFDFNSVKESTKASANRDVITDFTHGLDDINLRTIDADMTRGGNQHFTFIGNSQFHREAGELHVVKHNVAGTANDKTYIDGDVNGDGRADFRIELTGNVHLTQSDFVL